MSEQCDLVLVEQAEGIATLTLNDPPKRNAFSKAMRETLIAVLSRLNADPDCRAIVITGAGSTFCSGGDISEMAPRTQLVSRERLVVTTDLARLMLTGPKPIVTAVEGAAMGAGLGMAAASDYAVVARDARLACAFLRVGLLPDFAAIWTIPRRVGLAKAQELFGLARTIDGAEAHRIGLANELAEPGETLARAQAVAREYTRMAPVPLAALRGALAEGFASLEAAIQFELVAQPLVQRTADHYEAVAGFREKRPPSFIGD
jgi:enoyl-CoA hydratase/carnithine racemase